MFLDHTQRRSTVGRTPLDEWSARRRDLCLTTHNTHNRQTSMPPGGIRTHDLSRRAAADLRLRPRGHWDRQLTSLLFLLLLCHLGFLKLFHIKILEVLLVSNRTACQSHPVGCLTLKLKAVWSFRTSGSWSTTGQYIPAHWRLSCSSLNLDFVKPAVQSALGHQPGKKNAWSFTFAHR